LKIRVNNIGIEPITYLMVDNQSTKPKDKESLNIVKYHKNRYFGMLEDYLQSGWEDKGNYLERQKATISKSHFEEEEAHYVIAHLHLYNNEMETIIEGVGDRLLYIEANEREDFFKVYSMADQMLHKLVEEREEQEKQEEKEQTIEI